MIETKTLERFEGLVCLELTYPKFRQMLMAATPQGPITAVQATVREIPVGLVIAGNRPGNFAWIYSLYVDAPHRNLGIGKLLLQHIESNLRQRGILHLHLGYRSGSSTAIAVERMLARLDWPRAVPERLLCVGDNQLLDKIDADWARAPPTPSADYEIVSWSEVTDRERHALVADQALNPWIPLGVDPFKYEATAEFNSVAMRYAGEIVGWVLTERFDASTLMYSCGYMRPDLQRRGWLVALYIEAMRRHARRSDIPNWRGAVPYKYRPMAAFMRRRLGHVVEFQDYLVSIKPIDSGGGGVK